MASEELAMEMVFERLSRDPEGAKTEKRLLFRIQDGADVGEDPTDLLCTGDGAFDAMNNNCQVKNFAWVSVSS